MQKAKYSVSVIIPTKTRANDLANCLDSVFAQSRRPMEVIVVDGGLPGNRQIFEDRYSQIKYLEYHLSSGLTDSKNFGVNNSKGDILLFLDDDIVLEKDFIEKILEIFDEKGINETGGVAGNIINQSSIKEKGLYYFIKKLFLLPMYGNGKFRWSGSPTFVYGSDRVMQVDFLPGGVTAYKRAVFCDFLFDDNLKGYCYGEDADFSYRESRKYKNYYTPYAKAIHNTSCEARGKGIGMLLNNILATFYRNKKNMGVKGIIASFIITIGMLVEAFYLKIKSYFFMPRTLRY